MPSAIVNLTEENSHLLNIMKAKLGISNKSDAINYIVNDYAKQTLEPELRPEYVKKLKRLLKQKPIVYGTVDEMIKAHEKGR